MKITWLSHSCFEFKTPNKTILIDPYFSGNNLATRSRELQRAGVDLKKYMLEQISQKLGAGFEPYKDKF